MRTDHVNGIIDGINDPDIKMRDKVWCVDYEYFKSLCLININLSMTYTTIYV